MIPVLLCAALACVVVDGDTLRVCPAHAGPAASGPVAACERVRLWGIDAPERGEAGAAAATAALAALAAGGLACEAPPSGQDRDRYGRAVRLCRTPDGRDVAAALVAGGHATDWARFSGGRYSSGALSRRTRAPLFERRSYTRD